MPLVEAERRWPADSMTMDDLSTLDALRRSYSETMGYPFRHFFCPILWRDDPVALCEGHVINEAFPGSDRSTVLQRKDVDNFFGTHFEADFVLLKDRGQHTAAEILTDPQLSRKFRPRLTADGVPVGHYLPKGPVPAGHSELLVEREGLPAVRLAIKLDPSQTLTSLSADWKIALGKDVRLSALVSLLKAAHLTMFGLMAYSYALTTAGRFIGWDVLGSFVKANMHLGDRPTVLRNASTHFLEFFELVRPVATWPHGLEGTITDRLMFVCTGSPKPWAFMVFVRTGTDMHAVLLPVMEDDESAARFIRFLRNPWRRVETRLVRFAGDRWEAAEDTRVIDWPDAGLDESSLVAR